MKHSLFEEIEFCLPVPIGEEFKHELIEGTVVKKGAVLAVKEERKKDAIDFKSKLKLDKSKNQKGVWVRVTKGDRSVKGSVLAEKISLWSRTRVTCPYDALVIEVSDSVIEIEEYGQDVELKAPIGGKVRDITPSQVTIVVDALQYQLGYGAGNAVWGELALCYGRGDGSDWMDSGLKDKVLVIEQLTPVVWHKANALGAKGIVASSASSIFEQWIDTKRDAAGVLVHDGNPDEWERLVEALEEYQGSVIFLVPQEKLLVIAKSS